MYHHQSLGLGDGGEGEGEGGDGGSDDGEEEGAGEEARESVEPHGDGALVPQRQHHEVGAQDEEEGGGRAHQRGDLVGADCHESSHRRLGALPDEPARRRHSPAPLLTAWVDSTLPHPQSYASCIGQPCDVPGRVIV